MAELLVKAKDAWGDLESRSRKGDIIVVRPDGWKWGSCECLPNFVVVKVPEKYEDVKHLEQSLMSEPDKDGKTEMLKVRKHYVSTKEVDDRSLEVKDFEKITVVSLKSAVLAKAVDSGDRI